MKHTQRFDVSEKKNTHKLWLISLPKHAIKGTIKVINQFLVIHLDSGLGIRLFFPHSLYLSPSWLMCVYVSFGVVGNIESSIMTGTRFNVTHTSIYR